MIIPPICFILGKQLHVKRDRTCVDLSFHFQRRYLLISTFGTHL